MTKNTCNYDSRQFIKTIFLSLMKMASRLGSLANQQQKPQSGMKMAALSSDLAQTKSLGPLGKKNGADRMLRDHYFASKDPILKCVVHEIVRLNSKIILILCIRQIDAIIKLRQKLVLHINVHQTRKQMHGSNTGDVSQKS